MSLSSKTNNNIKAKTNTKVNTKANVDVDDEWSSFITGACDDDSDDVECNINYDMLAKYDIKNDMKNDTKKSNITKKSDITTTNDITTKTVCNDIEFETSNADESKANTNKTIEPFSISSGNIPIIKTTKNATNALCINNIDEVDLNLNELETDMDNTNNNLVDDLEVWADLAQYMTKYRYY